MTASRVVILGGGPAGLGAAWRLRKAGKAAVTVLEQSRAVGGNAGSFELAGVICDYGSHRLHPSTPPDVMADVRAMLGEDLLDRPRHGRIRLMGRWIHFPLEPIDLLLHAPGRFKAGVAKDAFRKRGARSRPAEAGRGSPPELSEGRGRGGSEPETFASVLQEGLGRTICESFYFPFAWKMWGQGPETLSPVQARKRVSAGSLGRMVKRVLEGARGRKGMRGHFFYPRMGYGQISRGFHEAAQRLGASFAFGARVLRVTSGRGGSATTVRYEQDGATRTIEADHVWSTIPVTAFARMMDPPAPAEVEDAARRVRFRSMVLVYLVLPEEQFTEYDAHYFPEREIPFTRLSEPKNYSVRGTPPGRTVLCAEIPCAREDEVWTLSDQALGERVAAGLAAAGLPLRTKPVEVAVKRLENAYPIYDLDSEARFAVIDRWVSGVPGVLTFGRLGLFAHDNTHHALNMGYAAADCLRADGSFDEEEWLGRRKEFLAHVVED
jgi:protoporphyrinogen oxidase